MNKMLWQKEIDGDLYIDLLKKVDHPIRLRRLKVKKNNDEALTARLSGNEKFKSGEFYSAMSEYNRSICLSETNSECLSLAFGNRSSCFEKLNMFGACLADIQLAKDYNYPEHLMPKLNERENRCKTQIGSERSMMNRPTLSLPANENLTCIANVLRIEVNDDFGRLVTATSDITIGETILVEKVYVRYVDEERNKCSNCGDENRNFIPCEDCSGAMFCCDDCSNNNFHRIECQMLIDTDFCKDENFSELFVLRSVIIGLNEFSSIGEMMEFVENSRATDPLEIPHSMSSSLAKYRAFFKLSSFVPDSQFSDLRRMAYYLYHAIKSSTLGAKFQTEAHRRFLPHLIIHHYSILRANNFATVMNTSSIDCGNEQSVNLVASYFNHSCWPNATIIKKNNLSVCKTILPIRQGDQIFISYVDEDDEEYKIEVRRQDYLQWGYGFRCKCRICENGPMENTSRLQDDDAFVMVVRDVDKLQENVDMTLIRNIIENCKKFLTKHEKSVPSRESMFIIHNFVAMLQMELDYQDQIPQ